MTDKVLIKQEIKRRIEKYGPDFKTPYDAMYQLLTLLDFIDSLPKEPASEDLEEELNHWQIYHDYPKEYLDLLNFARHFAKWQKEKDKQLAGATQKISHQHGYDMMTEAESKNTNVSPILYGVIHSNKRDIILKELEQLYNNLGINNELSTPDYLLAEYTLNCLIAYGNAMNKNKEKGYIKPTFED